MKNALATVAILLIAVVGAIGGGIVIVFIANLLGINPLFLYPLAV